MSASLRGQKGYSLARGVRKHRPGSRVKNQNVIDNILRSFKSLGSFELLKSFEGLKLTKMAVKDDLITFEKLKKLSGINHTRLQHWFREKLLKFEYDGRTRLFPREENIIRIKFICARKRGDTWVPLDEIRKMIEAGEHRKEER